jgi:MtN3 and saliva related transmembrane protein
MTLDATDIIGTLSGLLTTIAFIPQVWRTWRTKSVEDLSFGMLLTFGAGVSGWLTYGILLRELPIILANAITLLLTGLLIAFKFRYRTGPVGR